MDGWMDGWMEGWKDGWMDEGRCLCVCSVLPILIVDCVQNVRLVTGAEQRTKTALVELIIETHNTKPKRRKAKKHRCTPENLRNGGMFAMLTIMCFFFAQAAELDLEVGSVALTAGICMTVGRGIYVGNANFFGQQPSSSGAEDASKEPAPRQDVFTAKLFGQVDYPLILIFVGQFIQIQGYVH